MDDLNNVNVTYLVEFKQCINGQETGESRSWEIEYPLEDCTTGVKGASLADVEEALDEMNEELSEKIEDERKFRQNQATKQVLTDFVVRMTTYGLSMPASGDPEYTPEDGRVRYNVVDPHGIRAEVTIQLHDPHTSEEES